MGAEENMMRYVDTNILARLLTNDVPILAGQAKEEVKRSASGELVILDAVLVELFFILEHNPQYRFTRDKTVLVFRTILTIPQFKLSEMAQAAFELFAAHSKLDFMDCLLAIHAGLHRDQLLTFDKELLKVTT